MSQRLNLWEKMEKFKKESAQNGSALARSSEKLTPPSSEAPVTDPTLPSNTITTNSQDLMNKQILKILQTMQKEMDKGFANLMKKYEETNDKLTAIQYHVIKLKAEQDEHRCEVLEKLNSIQCAVENVDLVSEAGRVSRGEDTPVMVVNEQEGFEFAPMQQALDHEEFDTSDISSLSDDEKFEILYNPRS